MILTRPAGGGGSRASLDIRINCTASEVVGSWVYLFGSDEVRNAKADDINTSQVLGRVIKKFSDTDCLVRRFGEVEIDTGLTPKDLYFLSATVDGEMTNTQPVGVPSGTVQAELGWAISDTRFFIDVFEKVHIRR
jgi:hypothetical protein